MRQSSSPSPDWGRPSPPERSRSGSGSNQPKPARWQAKTPPEDCKNTQKTEAWEKWTWEDWQSQSWEQQGWEEQWQEKKMPGGKKKKMSGKKGGGHGRVSLMTGQTGPGKAGTRMHGLRTASPRKKIGGCQKKKEHQAAAEPQAAMCKDRGWPK